MDFVSYIIHLRTGPLNPVPSEVEMFQSFRFVFAGILLVCFGSIQVVSVFATGPRPMNTGSQQTSSGATVIIAPAIHAITEEEREALAAQLSSSPGFQIRVNPSTDSGGNAGPVSIFSTDVRSVRRTPESFGDSPASPANDYAMSAAFSLHNERRERVTGLGIKLTNLAAGSAFFAYPIFPAPDQGDFSYQIPLMLVSGDPAELEAEVVGVKFKNGEVWGFYPAPPELRLPLGAAAGISLARGSSKRNIARLNGAAFASTLDR